jgi:hypothetical protein
MPTFEPNVDKPDQPHLGSPRLRDVKGEPIEKVTSEATVIHSVT